MISIFGMISILSIFIFFIFCFVPLFAQLTEIKSEICNAIKFFGIKSEFRYDNTWYPTWELNDTLYSHRTDGKTKRLDGYADWSQSGVHPVHITTGQSDKFSSMYRKNIQRT